MSITEQRISSLHWIFEDFLMHIENEITYTSDELMEYCQVAQMSGNGSRMSKGLSKGRSFVMFQGTGGTGSSSSDSIQKPQNWRFRQCDYCEVWTSCRTRWCDGCREKVYCGRLCQKQDWPVHKESCKCAGKTSMGSGKGKQRSESTTLGEPRTADSDKIMCEIMEILAEGPEDSRRALLEILPYNLKEAQNKMDEHSKAWRMLDDLRKGA